MFKKIVTGVLATALCFSLVGCGSDSKEETTTAEAEVTEAEATEADDTATEDAAATVDDKAKVQEKGKLVVGITDFEPMDYKDDNGEWTGFDAELAKGFAQKLGVSVEFVEIDWDNKILELDSGNIDCVWNGMTLTDEVLSSMDCSNPYCNNAQIVIVPKDQADKYQDEESVKDLTFAVEAGSAGEAIAKERGFNYNPVQNQAAALMEVNAGTSDAAIIDSLMAAAMVGDGTSYDGLTYTCGLNDEEYGVGFRKGSNLKEELNTYLKEAYADNTLQTIAEKYGVQASLIEQQ